MDFFNLRVMNFDNAIKGMRNSYASWAKSDSFYYIIGEWDDTQAERVAQAWVNYINPKMYLEDKNGFLLLQDQYMSWLSENGTLYRDDEYLEVFYFGPQDLTLAQKLVKAGSSHRKFLRQVLVSIDIDAPLYWWKEFDTYKIGTTANSTSTMHKLANIPITLNCFEKNDYNEDLEVNYNDPVEDDDGWIEHWHIDMFTDYLIQHLEELRQMYLKTNDKRYWKELIRWLPESWLQTRTVTMNYEVLRNIYKQRMCHKLSEWHSFCNWIETLPYSKQLITYCI